MPAIRRKRKRSFRPYKKRPLGKRQARAVATIAKKQIRKTSEWKHHDTTINQTPSTTAVLDDLSLVAPGDADTQRDGDSIFASSISLRLTAELASTDTYNSVRVIVFQWKADTPPAIDSILLTSSTNRQNSLYNVDKAQIHRILMDRVFTVNPDRPAINLRKKIRLSSRKIQYNAGTTAGINKVFMYCLSDSPAINHPKLFGMTRLNYRDG